MYKKKTLQELTLKDNFLFAAVMMEQENCRRLLEQLVKFLKYAAAELSESTRDFKDEFVAGLQASIINIKSSREMGNGICCLKKC